MKNLAPRSLLIPLLLAAGCADAPADPRPSIVLIVIDTLRVDAVSSYGQVVGTTPELDELAREGLRYERAYTSAPWTLPSHTTLFTGLGVDQHRVGMPSRAVLPESEVTLAERLRDAGYETAGFSENAIVSGLFGLAQGFQRHRSAKIMEHNGQQVPIDAPDFVEQWLRLRDPTRPYFLFVNLSDPHHPYTIRDENPFVAAGTPAELIATRPDRPNRLLCGGLPGAEMLRILRGLYLGDVQAADAKAGKIARMVRAADEGREPIIVVVADHGEYFGEERLMGHEFGLHEAVLHVPLIVTGLPGVAPAVIPDTVGLVDLAPTILAWAGLEIPEQMVGRPLPRESGGGAGDRAIFAFYDDSTHWMPSSWREVGRTPYDPDDTRQFCHESDPVWGGLAAIVQYPHKFLWYQRRGPALFDLSWDRAQKSDQADQQPAVLERFSSEIEPRVRAAGIADAGEKRGAAELSKEARAALEALGYAE